jgi:conjugative relaxase-like TrwC/TraI family protein
VVSIAKLGSGGGRYYVEKVRERVDHRRAVSSGADDYYLAGPEGAGTWVGTVTRELDLEGREVTEEALDRALSAADLITGRRLAGPIGRATIPGFDLTFSVPKSVSLLWALGDRSAPAEPPAGFRAQGSSPRRSSTGPHAPATRTSTPTC